MTIRGRSLRSNVCLVWSRRGTKRFRLPEIAVYREVFRVLGLLNPRPPWRKRGYSTIMNMSECCGLLRPIALMFAHARDSAAT